LEDRRRDGRVGGHPDAKRAVGEPVQVVALGVVEAKGPGHGIEDLAARLDRPALLQPGVPGHPDAGLLRHLLAAQPRGTPPGTRRRFRAPDPATARSWRSW